MARRRSIVVALVLAVLVVSAGFAGGTGEQASDAAPMAPPMMEANPAGSNTMDSGSMESEPASDGREVAVLAGGCFWGMEAVFEDLTGVFDVESGYSGGEAATADYRTVSTGRTGHAESVRIVFDPSVISYDTLLDVFFSVAHDPTQLNYQGPDHGTQYRSAIFYANDSQRVAAQRHVDQLDQAGVYAQPVVTQVVPLDRFYPAEEYHQDFIKKNPTYPYVVYWDLPKLEHLAEAYPDLIAPN